MAERWHARLSRFFGHDLRGRQAVILYAVPAHFRQTNAVEGLIGEGTGGVTEAMKRRIVLPMSGSLADTDHVLGHELVHAFQFDLTGADPRESDGAARPASCSFRCGSSRAWPSTCRSVPSTRRRRCGCATRRCARSCRTSATSTIRSTFPYRWGHAFWAFIGAKYGDRDGGVADPIGRQSALRSRRPRAAARHRSRHADRRLARRRFRQSRRAVADDLSPLASEARPAIDRRTAAAAASTSGRGSVPTAARSRSSRSAIGSRSSSTSPMPRPAGSSGSCSQSATDPHFDSLEFLNSAGAWSPDGTTLAIAAHARRAGPCWRLIDPAIGPRHARGARCRASTMRCNPAFAPDGTVDGRSAAIAAG